MPRSSPQAATAPSPSPDEIAAAAVPIAADRITLQEAAKRFGVSASTLGSWCRSGEIDAAKQQGRWMVVPRSVSTRQRAGRSRGGTALAARSGPSADGSAMLVPRHAWDKLMDQLGNLHQAGQQLAEARERAARAETEARFLRERLGEMRQERDTLRRRVGEEPAPARGTVPLRTRLARIFGRG